MIDLEILLKVAIVLIGLPILYCLRIYFVGGKCESKARLDGKTVIITGARSGIGKATAIDLARRGARVIMGCRNLKSELDESKYLSEAYIEVKKKSGSDLVFLELLDLASLKSIHAFVKRFTLKYRELHILINNAGVKECPGRWNTKDGFEMQFGVNHLGHFALTNLLLPCMKASGTGRVINVSCHTHNAGTINFDDINSEKNYDKESAYCQSKLANVIFTKELARKLQETDISAFSLHPGYVMWTRINQYNPDPAPIGKMVFIHALIHFCRKTPTQGAQTSIFCAVEKDLEQHSGLYFADCALRGTNEKTHDRGVAKKLWELSERMTGVSFPQF